MTCHYPYLHSSSDWMKKIFNLIWVFTTGRQYHHLILSVEMTPYGNGSSASSLAKDFKLSDRSSTKSRNSSGPKLYLAETLMSMVKGWRICHHREQTVSAVPKE